jgi:hypothetical protein
MPITPPCVSIVMIDLRFSLFSFVLNGRHRTTTLTVSFSLLSGRDAGTDTGTGATTPSSSVSISTQQKKTQETPRNCDGGAGRH